MVAHLWRAVVCRRHSCRGGGSCRSHSLPQPLAQRSRIMFVSLGWAGSVTLRPGPNSTSGAVVRHECHEEQVGSTAVGQRNAASAATHAACIACTCNSLHPGSGIGTL